MKENAVTEAEYVAAKAHQLAHPAEYALAEPSDEVLTNVATINEFEYAEPVRAEELQRERGGA